MSSLEYPKRFTSSSMSSSRRRQRHRSRMDCSLSGLMTPRCLESAFSKSSRRSSPLSFTASEIFSCSTPISEPSGW